MNQTNIFERTQNPNRFACFRVFLALLVLLAEADLSSDFTEPVELSTLIQSKEAGMVGSGCDMSEEPRGSTFIFTDEPFVDSEKLLTSTIAIVFVAASDAMPLPSPRVLLDSKPLSCLRLMSNDIRFGIACGVLVLDITQSNRLFSLSQFSGACQS